MRWWLFSFFLLVVSSNVVLCVLEEKCGYLECYRCTHFKWHLFFYLAGPNYRKSSSTWANTIQKTWTRQKFYPKRHLVSSREKFIHNSNICWLSPTGTFFGGVFQKILIFSAAFFFLLLAVICFSQFFFFWIWFVCEIPCGSGFVSFGHRRCHKIVDFDSYDVAVLKLSRSVSFRDNILPICLPPQGKDYEGALGVVAGWGKTDTSFGTNCFRHSS